MAAKIILPQYLFDLYMVKDMAALELDNVM